MAFVKYWNDMDDTFKNTEECNPYKERKIFIFLGSTFANTLSYDC